MFIFSSNILTRATKKKNGNKVFYKILKLDFHVKKQNEKIILIKLIVPKALFIHKPICYIPSLNKVIHTKAPYPPIYCHPARSRC